MAVKSKYPDVLIPDNLSWPDFVFKNFEGFGNHTAIVSLLSVKYKLSVVSAKNFITS